MLKISNQKKSVQEKKTAKKAKLIKSAFFL